jgi:hypothetical protein
LRTAYLDIVAFGLDNWILKQLAVAASKPPLHWLTLRGLKIAAGFEKLSARRIRFAASLKR